MIWGYPYYWKHPYVWKASFPKTLTHMVRVNICGRCPVSIGGFHDGEDGGQDRGAEHLDVNKTISAVFKKLICTLPETNIAMENPPF